MNQDGYRALVVDDDAIAREIIIHALTQHGFICDQAVDGNDARRQLASKGYDLVVTDLRMPNCHGYALSIELLRLPTRPVVIIVTGITDTRLAHDLLGRGVDDIMFKPVDGRLLATKATWLLTRRSAAGDGSILAAREVGDFDSILQAQPVRRVDSAELQGRVATHARLVSISAPALEALSLASAGDPGAGQIATALARDAGVADELLRIANTNFYNPSSGKPLDLEAAVSRIGGKRIGELATATTSFAGLTGSRLPWIDVPLAWRRIMAGAIAIELLGQSPCRIASQAGTFLSTLVQDLGRIALGTLFTSEYEAMLASCGRFGTSLLMEERRVFPERHTSVMARLLTHWDVPRESYQPLKYLATNYRRLEQLEDPLRAKVELVKIATLVGRLAAGKWEPWQLVEVPPAEVLVRLNLMGYLADLVDRTRIELAGMPPPPLHCTARDASGEPSAHPPARHVMYCRVGPTPFDFVKEIVRSAGIGVVECTPESLETIDGVVVNCLGTPAPRLAAYLPRPVEPRRRVIITDQHRTEEYAALGTPVALPGSYGSLHRECWEVGFATRTAKR